MKNGGKNKSIAFIILFSIYSIQCWEGYFGNVIGYRLQVTLLKM